MMLDEGNQLASNHDRFGASLVPEYAATAARAHAGEEIFSRISHS